MTIFRSELTCAALVAATAASLAAQNPPIQRPIQQAQAAGQPAAAQPAPAAAPSGGRVIMTSPGADATVTQQGQAPASHTVREGDTLWALAQQYLGDPMLWPEIYRLNTNVVEDPHWIYPGEELRITPEAGSVVSGEPTTPAGGTDTAVVASQGMEVTPTPRDSQQNESAAGPPPATTGPTIFSTTGQRRTASLQAAGQRAYRAVREGEYYASGFLTENQPLEAGRVVGMVSTSTRGAIRTRTSALLYEDVVVEPPAGQTFAVNDLLLPFRVGDEVDEYGNMITPTGLLQVKEQRGAMWIATVIRVFSQIADNQGLIKVVPFVNNSSQRAQPVTGGLQGRVLRLRNSADVAQMQNVVFFDKGANEGLRLGDVLQVYLTRTDTLTSSFLEQDQARVIIVNTRPNTSTGVIVDLYRGDIGSRSSFRLVRRMPS